MRTRTLLATLTAGALAIPGIAAAAPADTPGTGFPDTIPLPASFAPEGIAIGGGHTLYAGSLAGGDIAVADLRTGELDILVDRDDSAAIGMSLDPSGTTLAVAAGPTGNLTIVDTATGTYEDVALPGAAFANDTITTRDAIWVTDSFAPAVFRVARDGSGVTRLAVTGDYGFVPGGFNFNGIEASADGDTVYVVSSSVGELLRLDVSDVTASSSTVEATVVDTDAVLASGDGILLEGRTMTVVRNSVNTVTTLRLSPDGTSAALVSEVTQADFAVPTTAASFGDTVYVVNARFGQDGPAGTPVASEVVAVD